MQELLINLAIILAKITAALVFTIALMVPAMVYIERRLVAFFQQRLGPNRVGPFGILQPIADALKLILKEDITPKGVDKILYFLAPAIALFCACMNVAVIPFGPDLQIMGRTIPLSVANLNVGILYMLAISSLSVYGIVLAGWSSNSKFSFLGGLRSTSQMISYELAMGMSLIGLIMLSQSLNLSDVVNAQSKWPFIIPQFIGFIIFFICMVAETNRAPFDLPEAETELVGGFHTEYSSMKFAIFFMSEYANMVIMSCLISTLFLGGWRWPIADPVALFGPYIGVLVGMGQFVAKIFAFLFIYIWLRSTFPRFRYDQLMKFGWLVLLPLGILNVVVTGIVLTWFR